MDFRISRSSVSGMDDAAFFWALIEPLWPDVNVVDELRHLSAATPGQQALYATTVFLREVDNGGLEQFFYNSSGLYTEAVRVGLRLLGAAQHLAALEAAIGLFPGAQVPVDGEERAKAIQGITRERGRRVFEEMDDQLFGEDRLWPFFRRYVEKHPEEFFMD